MIPTPEQIAAMKNRGWSYDAEGQTFWAGAGPGSEESALRLRVRPAAARGWVVFVGIPGHDYSRGLIYPDPMFAADEAEGWLRAEVARFTFPWLSPPAVPVQQEDGTLWRILDGVTYLSADEGLTWQRVPSCGDARCTLPATHVVGGYGFCAECAPLWKAQPHHIADRPFDALWRRSIIAADHGGALGAVWAAAIAETDDAPSEEPLDTRWPAELRQEIDALRAGLAEARDLARRFKAADTVMPWEFPDWLDEDADDEVSDDAGSVP